MTSTVFPVGHYTGIVPTAIGTPEYSVRVGLEQHRLSDEQFGLWMAVHGPAEGGSAPWTTSRVLALARELRLSGAPEQLAALERRGLVVEADATAGDFARAYRLCSLLIGLGDAGEEPGRYRVGVPETGPVAVLELDAYQLWQWAATTPSLWASCELRATVFAGDRENVDPLRAMDGVLRDVRTLVLHGCGYLDVVG